MTKEFVTSYESSTQVRSVLELAHEVKKAFLANETQTGFKLNPNQKRKVLRHELLHHIPLEHRKVIIEGLWREIDGTYRHSVSIEHPNASGREEVVSSLFPIFDRRFKHKLSTQDIMAGISGLLGILVGK